MGHAELELRLERVPPSTRDREQAKLLASTLRRISKLAAFKAFSVDLRWANRANALALLKSLPFTSRKDLDSNLDDYVSTPKKGLREALTSGTSGSPLSLLRSESEYDLERSYVRAAWHRMGIAKGELGAVITGRRLKEGRDHLVDEVRGLVWISCREIDEVTWERALGIIDQYGPAYVRGNGSLVGELFAFLNASKRPLPPTVRAVAYSVDAMIESQRQAVSEIVGRPPIALYGQTERACMAVSCEKAPQYHVFVSYGLVELIDEHGSPITEPNVVGEIVGTSLFPRATAMVRYRTGDLASWSDGSCPCGRTQPRLQEIAGRTQNFLIDARGTRVLLTRGDYSKVLAMLPVGASMQLVHEHRGVLEARVSRCSPDQRYQIGDLLRETVGPHFSVSVTDTAPIMTEAGKRPIVVNSVQ